MSYYRRRFSFYRPRAGYYRRGFNRYYRRRGFYRGSVLRQQQRGTRQFTVVFPVEDVYSVTIAANGRFSELIRTNPFSCYLGTASVGAQKRAYAQSLMRSEAFRRFCQLYDQCKINYVSHVVGICDPLGTATLPALKVYTSWDRDFNSGDGVPSEEEMVNGPESENRMFVNNSRAVLNRFCVARDLSERTSYLDTSYSFNANGASYVNAFNAGQTRGCFVPAMFMCIETSNTDEAARSIKVSIATKYSVTFRNPKFGMSVAGAGVKTVSDPAVSDAPVKIEEKKPDTEMSDGDGDGDGGETEIRTDMTDEEIEALIKKLKEKG